MFVYKFYRKYSFSLGFSKFMLLEFNCYFSNYFSPCSFQLLINSDDYICKFDALVFDNNDIQAHK